MSVQIYDIGDVISIIWVSLIYVFNGVDSKLDESILRIFHILRKKI